MRPTLLLSVIAAFCSTTSLSAAEPLQSGIQAGEKITAIFEPLNVTGQYAGQPHCLVCENGASPVAMVFARDATEPVLKLIAQLDKATAKHKDQSLGSFVVFLSEEEGLDKRLAEAAKQRGLKHTVLAIDSPVGPDGFKVAKAAAVTVVLYRDFDVQANHAFRTGELTDQRIEQIVADIRKIVPAK
jgi:hypothetical protein